MWCKSKCFGNGLFTYHLLQHLTEQNLSVKSMIDRVSAGMEKDAGYKSEVPKSQNLSVLEICLNLIDSTDIITTEISQYCCIVQK